MKLYRLPPYILQAVIWIPCRILFKFFVHIQVKGSEHIDTMKGPILLASNHVSEIDVILIRSCLPFFWPASPMFYVARPKDFYDDQSFGWRRIVYGGWFFKAWGAYPAYKGKQDYRFSLQEFKPLMKNAGALVIFPEGKRSKDGKIRESHGGVSFLSHEHNAPIIPVLISGVEKMGISFWFRTRRVTVTYGKPMYPQELFDTTEPVVQGDRNDFRTAAERVVKEIHKLDS